MGPRQEVQVALFYEFSLEDQVPKDQLLRSISRFVNMDRIRGHLTDFYSYIVRPSVNTELLIRILLVCDCFGNRQNYRSLTNTEIALGDDANHIIRAAIGNFNLQ